MNKNVVSIFDYAVEYHFAAIVYELLVAALVNVYLAIILAYQLLDQPYFYIIFSTEISVYYLFFVWHTLCCLLTFLLT